MTLDILEKWIKDILTSVDTDDYQKYDLKVGLQSIYEMNGDMIETIIDDAFAWYYALKSKKEEVKREVLISAAIISAFNNDAVNKQKLRRFKHYKIKI